MSIDVKRMFVPQFWAATLADILESRIDSILEKELKCPKSVMCGVASIPLAPGVNATIPADTRRILNEKYRKSGWSSVRFFENCIELRVEEGDLVNAWSREVCY